MMTHSHNFKAFTICIPHLIFLSCLTLLLFDPDWFVLALVSPIIIASADNLYVCSILSSSHDRRVICCLLLFVSLIFNISSHFFIITVFFSLCIILNFVHHIFLDFLKRSRCFFNLIINDGHLQHMYMLNKTCCSWHCTARFDWNISVVLNQRLFQFKTPNFILSYHMSPWHLSPNTCTTFSDHFFAYTEASHLNGACSFTLWLLFGAAINL